MDLQEKYEILKKEVDLLQIEASKSKRPWHQTPSIIISVIALAFSFGTTAVSYYKNYDEGVRANRREARELIQRVTKLPIENFELMQRAEGSPAGESLSSMINQENILLASQAVELIKRYPDTFSSTEYFAVAFALSQSNIRDNVPYLFENAISRAKNYNDYNVSVRAFGTYQFMQGNVSEGRKLYKKALSVWKKFPEKNPYVIHSFDLVTFMYWAMAELSVGNVSEASDLIKKSRQSLGKLQHSPFRDTLARQVADIEERIRVSNSDGR